MISSARARMDGGIVSPSALAVLRLITSSNFVGCSTGRSPGLAPLKILLLTEGGERSRKHACSKCKQKSSPGDHDAGPAGDRCEAIEHGGVGIHTHLSKVCLANSTVA